MSDGGRICFNVRDPEFTIYLPAEGKGNGVAVILLPGGALRMLEIGGKAKTMISRFTQEGIAIFVLKYRTLQAPPRESLPPLERGNIIGIAHLTRGLDGWFGVCEVAVQSRPAKHTRSTTVACSELTSRTLVPSLKAPNRAP